MHFSGWWDLLGVDVAVLKQTTGVVFAGRIQALELGHLGCCWSCPSPFGMLLWRGRFSCIVDLQFHHLSPTLGSAKERK